MRFSAIFCFLFLPVMGQFVQAETDPTAGLYVCPGKDGLKNIVNKPTGEGCEPYRKGLLTGGGASQPTPAKPPLKKDPPTIKPNAPPLTKSENPSPPSETKQPKVAEKKAHLPENSLPSSEKKEPDLLFPPAENFTGTGKGELYQLFGIKIPEKIIASTTKDGKQIWVCPQSNGTPIIVESETPIDSTCQPLGQKAGTAGTKSPPKLPNRGKPLVGKVEEVINQTIGKDKPSGSGEIALTDGTPQDIFKCFDKNGKPNYVGENQREHFKNCEFFSRSFAKARADFIRKATQKKDLLALATAGVQKSTLDYSVGGVQGLKCTGAGRIEFNGQTRQFNCATRSFDYTPGTSGGNVRLGTKQASIAAHNLDYLNSQGSCGGTVTSENGRVFHLEPTKDCPQVFVIQAQKIRVQVEKQLNINTSGAFRERQRALSAQINQIAREVGVDPFWVHAIISAESAYKTRARSHVGARGLMQLMPATARRFGVTDSYHTGQNIRGGATYLKWLLNFFKGDIELATAAYNAGEGNVRKYGNRIPPFIETRAYVPKVMQYYRRYRNNPHEVGL